MNGYTPENDYVITDTMAAVENVPAQQPEPESEPTGQPAGQETAEPGAQQQETPTEPQPAPQQETQQQPRNGGPDAEFAAQRRQMEAAQAEANQRLFLQLTEGLTNPVTGRPFASMEEWNGWREEQRLALQARQTGQTVVRQMEAAAMERARQQLESSPEYLAQQAQAKAMQQQMQRMQFAADLAQIKAAYPSEQAETVEELGETYIRLRAAGIDNLTAYKVLQAQAAQTVAAAPPSTGDVKPAADTRKSEFYTSEELDRMSDEELEANWDKAYKSMMRLGR